MKMVKKNDSEREIWVSGNQDMHEKWEKEENKWRHRVNEGGTRVYALGGLAGSDSSSRIMNELSSYSTSRNS